MTKGLKYLLLSAAMLLTVSCRQRPEGVLSPRQMRKLLVELHLTEGALQVKGYSERGYSEECNDYYQSVLQKHNTTQALFDSSIVYYTAHPNRFEKIYLNVVNDLNKLIAQQEQLAGQIPRGTRPHLSMLDCIEPTYPKQADAQQARLFNMLSGKVERPTNLTPTHYVLPVGIAPRNSGAPEPVDEFKVLTEQATITLAPPDTFPAPAEDTVPKRRRSLPSLLQNMQPQE